MSNSPSFPNMPADAGLPDIGTSDPMGTNAPLQSAGGKTKVSPTSQEGPSYQGANGYGFMTNDASMKIQGEAPSGQNSSGIPAAQPIQPLTYGDPNQTAMDAQDFGAPRHGF